MWYIFSILIFLLNSYDYINTSQCKYLCIFNFKYPGKAHPNNLQKMEVNTMTDEECRNVFWHPGYIMPGMICAIKSKSGVCKVSEFYIS